MVNAMDSMVETSHPTITMNAKSKVTIPTMVNTEKKATMAFLREEEPIHSRESKEATNPVITTRTRKDNNRDKIAPKNAVCNKASLKIIDPNLKQVANPLPSELGAFSLISSMRSSITLK